LRPINQNFRPLAIDHDHHRIDVVQRIGDPVSPILPRCNRIVIKKAMFLAELLEFIVERARRLRRLRVDSL
jgi:hypothetical protein